MVLGYFGKTPVAPDPQVVKWASEQLGLEPTTKSVVELNDANPALGIKPATETLQKNNLPVTDENIFIIAACGDKGLAFLKGDRPLGIRYNEDKKDAAPAGKLPAAYTATVEGKSFNVQVVSAPLPGTVVRMSVQPGDEVAAGDELLVIEAMKMETPVKAEKAGTVVEFLVEPKDVITADQAIVVIEEK